MDHLIDVLIAVVTGVAILTLISLGLAVIFGMMRVINFAHGEFIMLGGYTTVMATRQGVNVWVAMLVLAPLVVGLIGAVAERLIVRGLRPNRHDDAGDLAAESLPDRKIPRAGWQHRSEASQSVHIRSARISSFSLRSRLWLRRCAFSFSPERDGD